MGPTYCASLVEVTVPVRLLGGRRLRTTLLSSADVVSPLQRPLRQQIYVGLAYSVRQERFFVAQFDAAQTFRQIVEPQSGQEPAPQLLKPLPGVSRVERGVHVDEVTVQGAQAQVLAGVEPDLCEPA